MLPLVLAFASASDVNVLSSSNFDSFVASNEVSLIEFFAPWCGHCKQLAPKFEQAATALKGIAALASVDCTGEGKEICERFGVRGYPTLKVFGKSGANSDYDKPREADAIISFMKKQNQPAFVVISSPEELENFKKTSFGAVAFLSAVSGPDYEEFTSVANIARNEYDFAVSASADLAASVGASLPSVVLFRNFDEEKVIYSDAISSEGVMEFLRAESFPLLGEVNAETYQKYMERGLPMFYFFVNPTGAGTETVTAAARAAAADFKGKLSFVTLDGVKWERFMTGTFSIKTMPAAAIHHKKKIYLMSGDLSQSSIKEFSEQYLAGKVEAVFKSQEVPATNDGPVTVVVGSTFDKIVMDSSKDVMVEFYAPWCGHCKTLAPIYDEVGLRFKSVPSVVVAKVDATENDTPADVSGFPTLIYYTAENKQGIPFDGDRSKAAIEAFIVEHGSEATKAGYAASLGQGAHEEL